MDRKKIERENVEAEELKSVNGGRYWERGKKAGR